MASVNRVPGGVTAAKGYRAASCAAGIKYKGRTDMALLVSDVPAAAAAGFTSNVMKAAPVIWDRNNITSCGKVQAVVVNSGIANACTGEEGLESCRRSAEAVSAALGIPAEYVAVGSTGVIGMPLPDDRIINGINMMIPALSDSIEAGTAAARAIMTTDTVKKEFAYSFVTSDGKTVTVGGMSKGSGMIHPNMCTMLCYVTTDMAIDRALIDEALHGAVDSSFNMITVDGDTSTNDTLILMANGLAGNKKVTEKDSDYDLFREALGLLTTDLAKLMARDGEGATKRIEMRVLGADTLAHAKVLAKSVVGSNLTKAMIFGKDANCGRVLCALGYSGIEFDPAKVDLWFVDPAGDRKLLLYTGGKFTGYDEEDAVTYMEGEEVVMACDMHMGEASAVAWGCDLTYDYVKINADYRS